MSEISIRPVTQKNWRTALALSVPPEQLHLVAGMAPIVALALAKAYIRLLDLHWDPYVFYADEAMIGFAAHAYEPGSPSNHWLFHFFIDQQYQGQGYGKQALRVLVQQVRVQHPTCRGSCGSMRTRSPMIARLMTSVWRAATPADGGATSASADERDGCSFIDVVCSPGLPETRQGAPFLG